LDSWGGGEPGVEESGKGGGKTTPRRGEKRHRVRPRTGRKRRLGRDCRRTSLGPGADFPFRGPDTQGIIGPEKKKKGREAAPFQGGNVKGDLVSLV